MITALGILAVIALLANVAALSFASLARKRAGLLDMANAAAVTASNAQAIAESAAADARAERDRLRAMILKRAERLSAKDLTNQQLARLVNAIASYGKPSPTEFVANPLSLLGSSEAKESTE